MIKFMEASTSIDAFRNIYTVWQQEDNRNPVPISKQEALEAWMTVKRWAAPSPTAKDLIYRVESSKRPCHVICYRGSGRTIFAGDEPRKGEGCVHWNLSARFTSNSGTESFHQYIAMLHEMGHFTQWNENNFFYEGNPIMHSASEFNRNVEDFYKKAAAERGITKYTDKRNYANARTLGAQAPSGKAWNVRLEMDNLIRHEWPICDEMKVPRRLSYTDLAMA